MSFFGMSKMVLRAMVRRPVTTRYPFEPRQPIPLSRGQLAIEIQKCIFCGACDKKCPTAAVAMDRATKTWTLNRLRCISCGACVDACPKKCLVLTTAHGVPTMTRDREVFTAAAAPVVAPAT